MCGGTYLDDTQIRGGSSMELGARGSEFGVTKPVFRRVVFRTPNYELRTDM